MDEQFDEIVEERDEIMVSISGNNPVRRKAHFLKPSIASIDGTVTELPLQAPCKHDHKTLIVDYLGWRFPQKDYDIWVRKLASLHEPTWRKAGIFDSIMASTYRIHRNPELIRAIAQKWCIGTKSFVFPWGEATITLEDVMIVLGYSVLGSPVSANLESKAMEDIKEKLEKRRLELNKSIAKKACQHSWMRTFMNSGDEIEHEAFLALWLSRFVFPLARVISKDVFDVAIYLARGTRIALAPAVLASIYRDLSLLKNKIISLGSEKAGKRKECSSRITLRSPFQLVQVWTWERFPELRPKPNLIKHGEPRLRQWDEVKRKIERLNVVLDSANVSFDWRPYTKPVKNLRLPKFYAGKERWLSVDHGLDDELMSFARCLRSVELVGIDSVEQYLPNRVSQQFGFDQDLPGHLEQSSTTPEAAWSNYNRPIRNAKLYIPSIHSKPCLTKRYSEWWKKSVKITGTTRKSVMKIDRQQLRTETAELRKEHTSDVKANCEAKREELSPMTVEIQKKLDNSAFPPGFTRKYGGFKATESIEDDQMTIAEFISSNRKNSKKNLLENHKQRCSDSTKEGNLSVLEMLGSNERNDKKAKRNGDATKRFERAVQKSSVGEPVIPVKNPVCKKRKHIDLTGECDRIVARIRKDHDEVVKRNKNNLPDQSETLSLSAANADRDRMLQTRKGEGQDLNKEPERIDGTGIRGSYSIEVPGLEIEARIVKLDKLLAELRAAKFGHGS